MFFSGLQSLEGYALGKLLCHQYGIFRGNRAIFGVLRTLEWKVAGRENVFDEVVLRSARHSPLSEHISPDRCNSH